MNNLTSYQLMDRGCRAFVNDPVAFPKGTNTEVYSDLDFLINKTDDTKVAKYTFDMGWMPDGATVVFEVESRLVSGPDNAVISVEDRTGYGLTDGRTICSVTECTRSSSYEIQRVQWTVRPGHNFVTLTITGATNETFTQKFRNPKFKILNGNVGKRSTLVCCLFRESGGSNWTFDTDNYINDGFTINTVGTEHIDLGFPMVLSGKRPIAHATMDYGTTSTGANKPVSASVASINEDQLNVALMGSSGSRVLTGEVNVCRIYISVVY